MTAPLAPNDVVEQRAGGVKRVAVVRTATATCLYACRMTTDNVGAAYSHARATGHVVQLHYAAEYLLVTPAPGGDEAPGGSR